MKKILLCLALLFVSALAASAQDADTLLIVGNATQVSRETGPGYTTDTMTIQVNALSIKVVCPASAGCFDPYWLGACAPVSTSSTGDPRVTTRSWSCTTSRPGRCVHITGHFVLASEGLRVTPDSLTAGYDCNW